MKLKGTVHVTRETEFETPAWFKTGIMFSFITEEAIIEVSNGIICKWTNNQYTSVFQEKALSASMGEPITKEQFEAEFDKTLASIIGMFSDKAPLKISA